MDNANLEDRAGFSHGHNDIEPVENRFGLFRPNTLADVPG